MNLYIVYELVTSSRDCRTNFTIRDWLFGAVKLAKNADHDKYGYSGYGIGLNARSSFSLPNREFGKNVAIFGVDNSPSFHTDNRKNNVLVFGECAADGLGDTTRTAEAKYSININK